MENPINSSFRFKKKYSQGLSMEIERKGIIINVY